MNKYLIIDKKTNQIKMIADAKLESVGETLKQVEFDVLPQVLEKINTGYRIFFNATTKQIDYKSTSLSDKHKNKTKNKKLKTKLKNGKATNKEVQSILKDLI